jgi:membrane-bound lytic murein transglycosylase F
MLKIVKFFSLFFLLVIIIIIVGESKTRDENTSAFFLEGDTLCVRIAIEGGIYIKQGHPSGFHHDLLKKFSTYQRCHLRLKPKGNMSMWEELITGETDILVISAETEIIPHEYTDKFISSVDVNDAGHAWVVDKSNIHLLQQLNYWLTFFKQSKDYTNLVSRYLKPYKGISFRLTSPTNSLSPFDDLIKKYSNNIGWDWRLLSSLIYQESKFLMNTSSIRGAHGLMQIKNATARQFGIDDVFDPEQNIKAGTMLIKRLQKLYDSPEIDSLNQIKLVLAAYNAGEGRVEDVRRVAAHLGANPNDWESLKDVIPKMRKREGIPINIIKLGQFKGTETTKFVDEIIERYNTYVVLVRK